MKTQVVTHIVIDNPFELGFSFGMGMIICILVACFVIKFFW